MDKQFPTLDRCQDVTGTGTGRSSKETNLARWSQEFPERIWSWQFVRDIRGKRSQQSLNPWRLFFLFGNKKMCKNQHWCAPLCVGLFYLKYPGQKRCARSSEIKSSCSPTMARARELAIICWLFQMLLNLTICSWT